MFAFLLLILCAPTIFCIKDNNITDIVNAFQLVQNPSTLKDGISLFERLGPSRPRNLAYVKLASNFFFGENGFPKEYFLTNALLSAVVNQQIRTTIQAKEKLISTVSSQCLESMKTGNLIVPIEPKTARSLSSMKIRLTELRNRFKESTIIEKESRIYILDLGDDIEISDKLPSPPGLDINQNFEDNIVKIIDRIMNALGHSEL